MKDMQRMMKEAQKMAAEMQKAQAELAEHRVRGLGRRRRGQGRRHRRSAHRFASRSIPSSLTDVDADDIEMIGDTVTAAVNDALDKARDAQAGSARSPRRWHGRTRPPRHRLS